jgi:hypothetical protein
MEEDFRMNEADKVSLLPRQAGNGEIGKRTPLKKVGDLEGLVRQLIQGHAEVANGEIETVMGNHYESFRSMYLRMEAMVRVLIQKGLLTEEEVIAEGDVLQSHQRGAVDIMSTTLTIEDRIEAMEKWNAGHPDDQMSPYDVELYPMITASQSLSNEEKYALLGKAGVSERVISKLKQYQDSKENEGERNAEDTTATS